MRQAEPRGFTLMELIVVIAIITFLTTVVLANTRPSTKRAALEGDVNTALAMLRQARINAVAVAEYGTNQFPSYGMYFSTVAAGGANQRLTMYADCVADDNGSGQIEYGDSFGYSASNCGGTGAVETVALSPGVTVNRIRYYPAGGAGSYSDLNNFSVLFLRPEPTIWYSSSNVTREAGVVEVRFRMDTGPRIEYISLRFNSSGLVERIP